MAQSRNSISVSYGWGMPGNLAGGQDIATRFSEQFQPDHGIFSPNYPLVPVEPEYTRVWDYPVGYNFVYTPRSYEPVGFQELRALATWENLTRMAIETRKDQIERLNWEIRQVDGDAALTPAISARIEDVTEFWRHPDGERSFGTWLRELLEDMLVIDAPTLEVRRNRGGTILGLDVIDGATIKLLIDHTGRRPKSPAPAFEQVIHGRPWRLLTDDELIYAPRNKRPGHVYGFSQVEQILTYINIALRRQTMQLDWFTESNLPPGFFDIPALNAAQVKELQDWLDAKLAGNLAERSRAQIVPWGARYTSIKTPPLKDEFDEWLARVVMFAFSLPPDAFVRQRNRSTSETAHQTAQEEGLGPLLLWVKRLVDDVIQKRMGHVDLEFAWQELKETDPQVQATILTEYVKMGIQSPNEARDTLGLDPVEGGDDPLLVLPSGPILLKHVEIASDQSANPAPPPNFGAPGAGGAADRGEASAAPVGASRTEPSVGSQKPPAAVRDGRSGSGDTDGAAKTFPHRTSAGAGFGAYGSAREALDREARQILRRSRAARVEADLRAAAS